MIILEDRFKYRTDLEICFHVEATNDLSECVSSNIVALYNSIDIAPMIKRNFPDIFIEIISLCAEKISLMVENARENQE